jgi:uncharacterized membrane protein
MVRLVRGRSERGAPLRVVVLFCCYAAVHSLLASREAKAWATRSFGSPRRNGLYRFVFNAQAVVLFGASAWAFVRLPDRTLYRVPAPWSWAMVAAQVSGMGLMAAAAHAVGFGRMTGVGPLLDLLRGRTPMPEPEAQGPVPDADGEMRVVGPFRFMRHPANWGPLPTVLLFPHMTINRAVLAVLSVAYLVVGSLHEERRLRAAYGEAYARYRARPIA